METITATLVFQTSNQRFYKLSHQITKGYRSFSGEAKDIVQELEAGKKTLKPEYSTVYDGLTGIDIVCVSDAHTHTERLVFAAIPHNGTYARTQVQIDGAHTMMIHGGDSKSCKPDAVYLRRLASLNGFYYSPDNIAA
jgi:hypothetical protein